MRLAVTADLHWGHRPSGDAATLALAAHVAELAPDAFAIAGDVGTGDKFGACLALFAALNCTRLVLPGNHDLWTSEPIPASLTLYEQTLPALSAQHGFQYLDAAPFLPVESDLAIVGNMNWYDYTLADPSVEAEMPDAPSYYRARMFPRGMHNDANFVRTGMTDDEFTGYLVARFQAQMASVPPAVQRVVCLQHHPPVRELFYPRAPESLMGRFWYAYTGNARMQAAVLSDPRITTLICGHTHNHLTTEVDGRRCLNIGGDYDWKRLLLLDTETGVEQWWDFGR